ncbi:unnamed protein product [Spirodela intermedia]|uniref:Protein BZR1 homolog n=1 Tax=Spirodela intermedia TaxID=51605 RepID=A0A7I8JPY4_SPIIN|nr:unnamed protein product [Spirodela intermedia]CAA6671492.1 unnamed protein product [Spirodela intermedia]
MTSGARLPTWKERENNKRRERRRRAIAAKIYAGLRMYGNYKLPKHCDNNEVLKALCREAGWTVEEDGSTYRKGCKPAEHMEVAGGSASPSPCSSYQPSPASSSFPSPASSSYITNGHNWAANSSEVNSMVPFLSSLASASSPPKRRRLISTTSTCTGGRSAPLSRRLSAPRRRARLGSRPTGTTQRRRRSGSCRRLPPAGLLLRPSASSRRTHSVASSARCPQLVEAPPRCGRRCRAAPALPPFQGKRTSHAAGPPSEEFAFGGGGGSCSNENALLLGPVKAWAGERIHEECGSDDLELTLGSSKSRSNA